MASIEIDFEVYKALTLRRESEATTYNDVLRDMLGLDSESPISAAKAAGATGAGCVLQGIHFPEGTEFRVTYKGRTHLARIQNGQWVDAPVTAATVQRLEDIILTRARDLRRTAVAR